MAYSTDSDLTDFIPDILDLGIEAFYDEHEKAQTDIHRALRNKWWPKTGYKNELDTSKLTASQFRDLSAYLVLWKYALPKLTNWTQGDRFMEMMDFYKARYNEEWETILSDGVEYDADDDGTVQNDEKRALYAGRLAR